MTWIAIGYKLSITSDGEIQMDTVIRLQCFKSSVNVHYDDENVADCLQFILQEKCLSEKGKKVLSSYEKYIENYCIFLNVEKSELKTKFGNLLLECVNGKNMENVAEYEKDRFVLEITTNFASFFNECVEIRKKFMETV